MKKLDIIIKASENGIKIPDDYKQTFLDLIKYCIEKRGGFLRLVLQPPFKHRSTGEKSQNHHINGHCQQISNETGQSFFDVKKYTKQIAIDIGYPILYSKDKEGNDDKAILDLWGNEQGISETEADTEQAGYLIEAVHEIADELGIKLKEN